VEGIDKTPFGMKIATIKASIGNIIVLLSPLKQSNKN
jgi:hypothetical protein